MYTYVLSQPWDLKSSFPSPPPLKLLIRMFRTFDMSLGSAFTDVLANGCVFEHLRGG